jgi:hypothetical protein
MNALIFVVKTVIRTGMIPPGEKALHLVLVQITDANVGIQILVKIVIDTAFAVGHDLLFGKFFVLHVSRLPSLSVVYHKKFIFARQFL